MSFPPNSNPRYRNFCQEFFTAGDEEQFQSYRDKTNAESGVDADAERGIDELWSKYIDLSAEDVTNTFRYIFHKFKKGIYIRIKDNKLVTFLPFSKAKFVNEWSDKIKINPKTSLIKFFEHINKMEGRPFNERKINKFFQNWYANNCLLRYEFPINEGDTGTQHMKAMFLELCEKRQVPNVELFLNRRDFPILKKDGTEPYEHIFNSFTYPLLSHNYDRYIPILSSVGRDGFADIPIPTLEDWARVKAAEGISYPKTSSQQYLYEFSTPWEDRKSIAVFRGGSTGVGVTIETNPRLKVAFMSSQNESNIDSSDKLPLIDAGITDWNLRPRKIMGEEFLKTIEIDTLPFQKIGKLTPEEQSHYKYIINIDGHSSAFRLSLEMKMGSVVLMVDSEYFLWFKKFLIPYKHYIPVKRDLSDLYEKIKWCKANDDECKKIVVECKLFYKNFLEKDGLLTYIQKLLMQLSKQMKNIKYSPLPLSIQLREEEDWLKSQNKMMKVDFSPTSSIIIGKTTLSKIVEVKGSLFKDSLFKHSLFKDSSSIILKVTDDESKRSENIHEAFIGLNEINYIFLDNFIRTIGFCPEHNAVVSEKIDGILFMDWLQSDAFNIDGYFKILAQLSLALHVSQNRFGFVHNDLFPWNVILKKNTKCLEYALWFDEVAYITPTIVPVMIDYGKSHCIINNRHYGYVNMFYSSTIHDVITIVFSTLAVIIKKPTYDKALQRLLKLINFFTETMFHPKKITSYYELQKFICINSSFSNLIQMNKKDLEQKTSYDFFKFLMSDIEPGWLTLKSYSTTTCGRPIRSIPNNSQYLLKDKAYVYYFMQRLVNGEDIREYFEKSKWSFFSIKKDLTSNLLSEEIFWNQKACENFRLKVQDFDFQKSFSDYLELLKTIFLHRGKYQLSQQDRKDIMDKFGHVKSFLFIKAYSADFNTLNYYISKKN